MHFVYRAEYLKNQNPLKTIHNTFKTIIARTDSFCLFKSKQDELYNLPTDTCEESTNKIYPVKKKCN